MNAILSWLTTTFSAAIFLVNPVTLRAAVSAPEPKTFQAQPLQETTPRSQRTAKNVTPAEAQTLLQSGNGIVIIDVRTQEEFAEGHIAGARNVNFNSPTFLQKMQEFAGKKILVHCASGGRSTRALNALSGISFSEIYHLNKGFNAWQEAGNPVSTQ